MTAPHCPLCGNTNEADLGEIIGICLDKDACHQRQYANARAAGAREERERLRGQINPTTLELIADSIEQDDELFGREPAGIFGAGMPDGGAPVVELLRGWAKTLRGE